VQEIILFIGVYKPEWLDEAKSLLEGRRRAEEILNWSPNATTPAPAREPSSAPASDPPTTPKVAAPSIDWMAMLRKVFGWTKSVFSVVAFPRVQGSVIGIAGAALLTFFSGFWPAAPKTDTAQLIGKTVGDKLAEELRSKLIQDIDAITKSDEFKKAMAKAVDEAKAANEKK
jgi:hypothetical protein